MTSKTFFDDTMAVCNFCFVFGRKMHALFW